MTKKLLLFGLCALVPALFCGAVQAQSDGRPADPGYTWSEPGRGDETGRRPSPEKKKYSNDFDRANKGDRRDDDRGRGKLRGDKRDDDRDRGQIRGDKRDNDRDRGKIRGDKRDDDRDRGQDDGNRPHFNKGQNKRPSKDGQGQPDGKRPRRPERR